MREILDRGKRIDNGEWVYGFLYETEKSSSYNAESYILEKERLTINYKCLKGIVTHILFVQVDPLTVGHNTLIPDKKNNTIFEGHIIKAKHTFHGSKLDFENKAIRNAYGKEISDFCYYYRNYVVEYSIKKGAYIARNGSDQYYLMQLVKNHSAEIIGNIHDNPELLKGETKK